MSGIYCLIYLLLQEEPYFPLKEGYVFIDTVPVEERVKGAQQPEKREDCEVKYLL